MPLLETLIGRGTTASKPAAAAANEGYIYFDTDLDKLQRSNGTSWDDVERADPSAGSGVDSGTSFPGSPSDRDLFFRSDRDLLYFYDLANTQWLTTTLYIQTLSPDKAQPQSTTFALRAPVMTADYDLWIEDFRAATFISAATPASNSFSLQPLKSDAGTNTNMGTAVNTTGNTQNQWARHKITVGASLGTGVEEVSLSCTNTGTPNGYVTAMYTYRLIG